jgi:hypothetical protein
MSHLAPGLATAVSSWLSVAGVVLIVVGVTLLVVVDAPRQAWRRIARFSARRRDGHGQGGRTGTTEASEVTGATGAIAHPPPLLRPAPKEAPAGSDKATGAPTRAVRRLLGR